MAYLTHSVNTSPTVIGEAGSYGITSPAMLALAVSSGKLALPSAGALCLGIALADQDTVVAGEKVTVQIKDICYWMANATIAMGDELATDANGKAVVATDGDYVLGIALEAGAAGKPVLCQLVKYAKAADAE